ncbi:MAG: thiamine pyrophosphate-binding protein [bacterium]
MINQVESEHMRVADYVMQVLADRGVRHIFLVTGGGAMHLNDALWGQKRIRGVFCHHEQACAMAAEGYARVTGGIGVLNVTTGPGGINALNGVFGAWTDSIPMLVISGQVKRETCMGSYPGLKMRQLGDQEADIISMVSPITKYAVLVKEPESIRYHLERALYLAEHGRPGPVWLDIPLDVQSALIRPDHLRAYQAEEDERSVDLDAVRSQCRIILDRICKAERPVILAGTGIRLAHAGEAFERVIRKLGIPVTTAWTHDTIASEDPLFCGRPGTIGDRAGNFTVQNADMLLVLGSRLNIRQVSYGWKSFAKNAFKIQVDVDPAELDKPTVKPDMPVCCDLLVFLDVLNAEIDARGKSLAGHNAWLAWCKERVTRYPVVLERHRVFNGYINPYHFIEKLFECLGENDVVVCANATATIIPFQAAKIKRGQRLFSNSGSASMGYDLPASVGAAVASNGRRVICLAGDGSLQMNIQELQTIVHNSLPIIIIVLNNDGYVSIRQTQANFFGHMIGESPKTGVSFPDIVKVAKAYGLPAVRLDSPDFPGALGEVLSGKGPCVVEVMLDPGQSFEPKTSSRKLPDGRMVSAPLEDMYPFLDREELKSNLLFQVAEE